MTRSKNVSLALSSGGARGIAHIGVIQSLEEKGYTIRSISGSSMGAVIGGFYAAGYLPSYTEWICSLSKMDVFRLMDFTISSQGFMKGTKVFSEMKKFIDDRNIEEFDIPFAAVAANLETMDEVVFRSGSLFEALRASIAIPSILTPYDNGKQLLVDGGVVNPIPINHLIPGDDDLIIAVDVNSLTPYRKPPDTEKRIIEKKKEKDDFTRLANQLKDKWLEIFPDKPPAPKKLGLMDLFTESLHLLQNQLTLLTMEKYKPDMHIKISKDACGTFDFHKSSQIIEEGKKAFETEYKAYLNGAS